MMAAIRCRRSDGRHPKVVECAAMSVSLRFEARNIGVGVAPEEELRPFEQGLPISQHPARRLGGEMEVESRPGQDSRFHFALRSALQPELESLRVPDRNGLGGRCVLVVSDSAIARDVLALASPISTGTPRCDEAIFDHQFRFRGVQILLVEDNDLNRELAINILRRVGIIVSVACDGQEALDMLSRQRFDGVLMDCQMPVLDGYAATCLLRRQAQWIDLPVIALTASALVGAREKALAAGMNDLVAKPIKVERLFATLARWVRPRTADFGKTSALL